MFVTIFDLFSLFHEAVAIPNQGSPHISPPARPRNVKRRKDKLTKKSQREVRKTQTLNISISLPPPMQRQKGNKPETQQINKMKKTSPKKDKTQTLNILISLAFQPRAVEKGKNKKSTNTCYGVEDKSGRMNKSLRFLPLPKKKQYKNRTKQGKSLSLQLIQAIYEWPCNLKIF